MKKLLLIPLFLLFTSYTPESTYCEGWEEGHCEGWRDVKGQFAICPIPPICPVAKIECDTGYRCGYNRGFKRGRADAKK